MSAVTERNVIQRLKQDENLKNSYLAQIEISKDLQWKRDELIEESKRERFGNVSNLQGIKEWKRRNHVCSADQWCQQKWCDISVLTKQLKWEKQMKTFFSNDDKWIIYNKNDRWNIVEFRILVRDNLFHGAKDPESERDLLVVKNWYLTLKSLVKIMIED